MTQDLAISHPGNPKITALTSPLSLDGQDSPGDYPVLQLRSLESGQTFAPLAANWSTNSLTTASVNGLPAGYALATLFVNGIPSISAILNIISVPVPIPFSITGLKTLSDALTGTSRTYGDIPEVMSFFLPRSAYFKLLSKAPQGL